MGFVIRPALHTDYEGIACVLAEVDQLHRERLPWLFSKPEFEPRSAQFFAELLAGDDAALFVADAGSVVGVASVLLKSAPSFPLFVEQTRAVLDNIAVSKLWRRKHMGTELTRAAEDWALRKGARYVELGVYEFNAEARAFYESLGYSPLMTKLRKPLLSGTEAPPAK